MWREHPLTPFATATAQASHLACKLVAHSHSARSSSAACDKTSSCPPRCLQDNAGAVNTTLAKLRCPPLSLSSSHSSVMSSRRSSVDSIISSRLSLDLSTQLPKWTMRWKQLVEALLQSNVYVRPSLKAIAFHELKQREVLRLLREFDDQHARGVCKVATFKQLLRLHFPNASQQEIANWVLWVERQKEAKTDAEVIAKARERGAMAMFNALDTNANGKIELSELMQLEVSSRLPFSFQLSPMRSHSGSDCERESHAAWRSSCAISDRCCLLRLAPPRDLSPPAKRRRSRPSPLKRWPPALPSSTELRRATSQSLSSSRWWTSWVC